MKHQFDIHKVGYSA